MNINNKSLDLFSKPGSMLNYKTFSRSAVFVLLSTIAVFKWQCLNQQILTDH